MHTHTQYTKRHNVDTDAPRVVPFGEGLGRDCAMAAVLAIVVAIIVLRLWRADLSIPIAYLGDAVALGATVKGVIENTWFLSNPSLGAPYGQNFADYPMSDYLHLLCLKALGMVGPTFAWAMNVYFILSFPAIAAASVWVLRRLGVSVWPSILASILFTFIPFHLYRNTQHLFSSAYFCIPFVFYAALRLALGQTIGSGIRNEAMWWKRRDVWVTVLFIFIVGGTGIYSVFFAIFFIGLGAFYGGALHRTAAPLREAAVIALGLIACTAAATAPTLIYAHQHGDNPVAVDRKPSEAEVYGLRITQLLMPIADHRVPQLASFRRRYDAEGTGIPVNENGTASLGIVGAAGFLFLFVYMAGWRDRAKISGLLPAVSALNMWAVLLATVGGFSAWIALLITPKIRAYNRISPYIAFLAFTAVAIAVDALLQRGGRIRRWTVVAIPVILIIGVLDQTSVMHVPDYDTVSRVFAEDHKFVSEIEQILPAGAMVFQLPYMPWPEYPHVNSLSGYELLRGYLHSKTLRWSYATMKGRPGDVWVQQVSSRPVAEMIDVLAIAGFAGIYVDLRGYADDNIAKSIGEFLGKPRAVAADGKRLFFSLTEFANSLRATYSERDWNRMHEAVLHPVMANWTNGCSFNEGGSGSSKWRWCQEKATLALYNSDNEPRHIKLSANATTGLQQPSELTVEASGASHKFKMAGHSPTRLEIPINLTPGTTFVRFLSTAAPLVAPGDPRKLVIRLGNFEVSDGGQPASFEWDSGCSRPESTVSEQWRWCSDSATLLINNSESGAKNVALDLSFHLGINQAAQFEIAAPGISETVDAHQGVSSLRRVVSVPSGVSRVQVRTNAKPLDAPGDPRRLVFKVVRSYAMDLNSFPVIYVN